MDQPIATRLQPATLPRMSRRAGPAVWALDAVTFAYLAIVSAIVAAARPPGAWIYLAYHAAVAVGIGLIVAAYRAYGGAFWSVLRHWYPAYLIPAGFREIHYLAPDVHPYDDLWFDRYLAWLDERLFGDAMGWMDRLAHPGVADFMTVGYVLYFVLPVAVGVPLYRARRAAFRESLAALLVAWYGSFICYLAVPAIGPHWFRVRPPALDGWLFSGAVYEGLKKAEWEMPDAFPSAHVLIALVVLVQAWRYRRRLFWALLGPSALSIAATVYLQWHYVVDVAASFVLVGPAVWAGRALSRRLDGPAPRPDPAPARCA